MNTIAAGNHQQIYFDHLDDIVITPGSGGTVKFDCSTPNSAATRPTARTIYSAATISIPAGSTVFLDAVGADATYTTDQTAFRNFKSSNTSTLRRMVADARSGYARSRLCVFGMSTEAGAGSLNASLYAGNSRSKSWPMQGFSLITKNKNVLDNLDFKGERTWQTLNMNL